VVQALLAVVHALAGGRDLRLKRLQVLLLLRERLRVAAGVALGRQALLLQLLQLLLLALQLARAAAQQARPMSGRCLVCKWPADKRSNSTLLAPYVRVYRFTKMTTTIPNFPHLQTLEKNCKVASHFEGADAPLVGLDLGGGCLQLPLSLLALRAQALRGALHL